MRILLAAPDRDLLECYQKLLEADLGETVTAFDGTQVLYLLSSEQFDIVVLDSEIPRIDYRHLVGRMREQGLPVIVLINEPVSVRRLTETPPANNYLSYPFSAADLAEIIKDTLEKKESGERMTVYGRDIDISAFRIEGGPYLTGGELDVLKALTEGRRVTDSQGVYVSALNMKLLEAGSRAKIRYRTGKGFELVNEDE